MFIGDDGASRGCEVPDPKRINLTMAKVAQTLPVVLAHPVGSATPFPAQSGEI